MNKQTFFLFLIKSIDKELLFAYNIKYRNETMFVKGEGNMKIVNKKKFIRSISITIGLVVFIILILINTSFSHTEIVYKKVAIISGDTLWSIAKHEKNNNLYFEDKDIRDIVDEIKFLNNLNSSNLKIGDELNIPII